VAATPEVAALLPEEHSGPVEMEHEQVAAEFAEELSRKILFRGLATADLLWPAARGSADTAPPTRELTR
jgi:hypothetical protein